MVNTSNDLKTGVIKIDCTDSQISHFKDINASGKRKQDDKFMLKDGKERTRTRESLNRTPR